MTKDGAVVEATPLCSAHPPPPTGHLCVPQGPVPAHLSLHPGTLKAQLKASVQIKNHGEDWCFVVFFFFKTIFVSSLHHRRGEESHPK